MEHNKVESGAMSWILRLVMVAVIQLLHLSSLSGFR